MTSRLHETQVLLNGATSKEQIRRERKKFISRTRRKKVLAEKMQGKSRKGNYIPDRRDFE